MKKIKNITILAVGLVSHFGVKFWCISPHLHFITTLLFLSFSNGKRIKFLVFSNLEAGKPNISSCISGALENVSMSALRGDAGFFGRNIWNSMRRAHWCLEQVLGHTFSSYYYHLFFYVLATTITWSLAGIFDLFFLRILLLKYTIRVE